MEMYKAAVCNELREMLAKWEKLLAETNPSIESITATRRRIIGLCGLLEQIEQTELKKSE